MRMKSLILIFIALGCGLVASIGISQVMDRGGSSSSMEMEQILVALKDIDISSKLDDKNVKLEDWPKAKIPEGSIRRLDDIKDKFANARFYKGEPIHVNKISDTTGGSPTHTIPSGYRVMPVKVDEDTVMRAIKPGDRVDIMVFLKRDPNNGVMETKTVTFLKNVRVFAVNTDTDRAGDTSETKSSGSFRTVSVLVKPEHAQELAVAARVGKIVLTLRNPEEQDTEGGTEQSVSIALILKGNAQMGSDAVAAGSTTPNFSQPFASAGGPVQWELRVMEPNGTSTWQWTDKKQLPIKTSGPPPEPEPSSDESNGKGSHEGSNNSESNGHSGNSGDAFSLR